MNSRFFRKVVDFELPPLGIYGVGFLFLPRDEKRLERSKALVTTVVENEGGTILGWRDVPVSPDCLGEFARNAIPSFHQIFIIFNKTEEDAIDRKLYILRKCLENGAKNLGWGMDDFYITSLSRRTIIYKGMFVSTQFSTFYPDLTDKDFKSALALVHQRYSTNTFPSWPLAQPFRYIAHNGEINTLRGNINKMQALDHTLTSPLFGSDIKKIFPVINRKKTQ